MNVTYMDEHKIDNIGVYFNDPNTDVDFLPSPFKITGERYVRDREVTYSVKAYITEELDVKSGCKVYKKKDSYRKCRNDEIKTQMNDLIGCVPIWFTENPGKCELVNMSRDAAGSLYDTLFDIYSKHYTSRCEEPCTSVTYKIKHISTDPRNGGSIFFVFDQSAVLTKTHLVISGFSLVNRIGGIIGFCRNILWFLLFLTGISRLIDIIKAHISFSKGKNENGED